jgi:hypothetical protein
VGKPERITAAGLGFGQEPVSAQVRAVISTLRTVAWM